MEIDGSIIRVDFSITYKGNTPPQGPYAPREDRYGRRDDDKYVIKARSRSVS